MTLTAAIRPDELARAQDIVRRLAALERGSAGDGERDAAQLIAAELEACGVHARIEAEEAHGTHWWPYGLPAFASTVAGLAAMRSRTPAARAVAAVVGGVAAASVAEDISGGPQVLRRLLPTRTTSNVVATVGDPDADHRVLVHAHHDAAHGGITFDARLAPLFAHGSTLSTFAAVLGGPALTAAGALVGSPALLRCGTALSAAATCVFADIGLRRPVPGANDNASGVACVVLLADRLRAAPPDGVAVTLLSTGSEESWLEGMAAFMRRHGHDLPVDRTTVIAVDQIGWRNLALRPGEGVWRERPTPPALAGLIADCARALRIDLARTFPAAFPSDGLIARRAGYRTATLVSIDDDERLPDYHTQRDTPERVDFSTVLDAAALIEAVIRRLGD